MDEVGKPLDVKHVKEQKTKENAENESEKLLGQMPTNLNASPTRVKREGIDTYNQTHPLGSGRPGRLLKWRISVKPGRGMARRATGVDIPTRAAGKNTSRTAMVPIAT